jgi:hypothetical protein
MAANAANKMGEIYQDYFEIYRLFNLKFLASYTALFFKYSS